MPDSGTAQWVRLCELNALAPTGARGFDLQGRGVDDLFVVRRHALLRGYINSCPHWPGASLPWRKHAYLDQGANHIVCHSHGAKFTLDDGLCVSGPCAGQHLQAVALRIEEGRYVSALLPMPR
ncbi:Rieske (2Fe-2S) protein [Paraburkholderia sp. DD10]|jgi:nitrite reductase/ring-hydroxylating ferredoxin subunit|uniref:Rieske (2Fe-2S) protein n=1 Tax=Paraburkholderia TaxID=1822464 RepID=UPI001FD5A0C1|nr:Rieske 2Fe-2S domain-containing protein [Paraburkholderia terricola]